MKGDGESRPGARIALGIVALALLAGCRPPAAGASAAPPLDPMGYLTPPVLTGAAGLADGGATLSGRAPPGAEVSLRAPGGESLSAEAGPDGAWSIGLPPATAPRMFAFEAALAGRTVHGEGAVLVLPSTAMPAALLRAGYGASPISGESVAGGGFRIAAVDYDEGGGGSVSGFARPGAPVRFMLDGQPAGGGEVERNGAFSLLDLNARKPFSMGPHAVRLDQRGESVTIQIAAANAASLGQDAFHAARDGAGWRIDWRIPGGGTQTTLVFDPPIGAKS